MSTRKKTYTKEFKEEAVRLAKRSQVARDLGIQVSMLRRWQLELEQHQENGLPPIMSTKS